jgi:hypothetical protein
VAETSCAASLIQAVRLGYFANENRILIMGDITA